MKRRVQSDDATTRLVWEPVAEELMCEECLKIVFWNFGFKRCPYCHRRIVEVQQRRIGTSAILGTLSSSGDVVEQ